MFDGLALKSKVGIPAAAVPQNAPGYWTPSKVMADNADEQDSLQVKVLSGGLNLAKVNPISLGSKLVEIPLATTLTGIVAILPEKAKRATYPILD